MPVWYFTGLFILYCLEFKDSYGDPLKDAFSILDDATTKIVAPSGFGSLLVYGIVVTVAFTIYLWMITVVTKIILPMRARWQKAHSDFHEKRQQRRQGKDQPGSQVTV